MFVIPITTTFLSRHWRRVLGWAIVVVDAERERSAAEKVEDAACRRFPLPADVSARCVREPLEHRAVPWGAALQRWWDAEVERSERGAVLRTVPVGMYGSAGSSTQGATGTE
jgi:hypothetical protein